jgi:hypothetical protein
MAMGFDIPKKKNGNSSDAIAHTVNLGHDMTIRFARVKEVLGGYSNQEILEILVEKAIEAYDDGKDPSVDMLPKKLRDFGLEEE